MLCFLYYFIVHHHQNRMNIQYISPSPNWVHWPIVWAMSWSCMHISALYNSCDDAASCMMFYSFEILSSFTLLMGKKVSYLLKANLFLIYQGRINMRAFILSLLLCLSVFAWCLFAWCSTFALLWSHAADQQHTNTHMSFSSVTLFVSSHALVLYSALWRPCLVSSHPPLSFLSFSLPLFLSRSLTLNSIISGEGQPVAWRSLSFSSVESLLLGQFCRSGQNDPALFHSWCKDHKIPRHHQHVLH